MVATKGLVGLRPTPEHVARVTAPPYDVIKPNSPLERCLQKDSASLYHVLLGDTPSLVLESLRTDGFVIEDEEPAYYVYEQRWGAGEARTGVIVGAAVTPYHQRQIIRHEKTFDDKVKGRIQLSRATRHSYGPVFVLTRARITGLLEDAKSGPPLYDFVTDFCGQGDLDGIANRVWRVLEASSIGQRILAALAPQPFYIADGHHRYHAALLNEQTHFLCYVTENARIEAYNRVVNGVRPFAEVADELPLRPVDSFRTPDKNVFCIYTREGSFELDAEEVPSDVVGALDASILERELYPKLGLTHAMISNRRHFDYYPESELEQMKAEVDAGRYDIAIALHPVALSELMAVADAGLYNPDIVMPEKSTFFSPKILSGLIIYRHPTRVR